jgi:hypothetical protein
MADMHVPRIAAAVALASLAGGTAAFAAPETTEPGVVYPVKTTLTPTGVTIAKDKFTRNGHARYPRGAVIRYMITNRTTKRVTVQIWTVKTKPIAPGGHDSILVNWNYRGRYVYRELAGKTPVGATRYVTIF